MNKEFIPYEQALELKELGFDEPTSFYWENNVIRPLPMKDEVGAFHFNRHTRTENAWICAPTFSQAFRWFREKYDYYISVFRTHDGNWGTDLWLLGVHKPKATVFSETYEEAELACLNKLIEIVKNETHKD